MKTYQAGIDVGSTTVKLVVLDENGQMIFGQYQRHLSHTQRALSDLLKQARAALGECALELRATGSGAINLAKALGIPFVQEHFELLIIGIVAVSIIPTVVGLVKAKLGKKNA